MERQETKGYKVTTSEMKCRGFKFEIGKIFKQKGKLEICENGFHFCQIAKDCFEYYEFVSTNRVFEVVAYGDIVTIGNKSCSLEIELIRELTWLEVLVVVNSGKDNTGHSNSGNSNSGNSNSGNRNSGDSNSGNWNSGNRNSGDSNSGYRNSGAFCTDSDPKLILFDKECSMTVKEWEIHPCCQIMNNLNPNIWIWSNEMNADERAQYPSHETTGGYLKSIPMKEAWANLWGNLADDKKALFPKLENWNSAKFFEITGIKA